MIVALCALSSTVRWVALDSQTGEVLAQRSWNDDQSRALSDSLRREFEELLKSLGQDTHSSLENVIEKLVVFTGPGAFTSLRMGVSFTLGLARGAGIPLIGIPTWELYQRDFYIPARHQLAKTLTLHQACEQGLEFLKVTGPQSAQLSTPSFETDFVRGTREHAAWPEVSEIAHAAFRARGESSREPLQIFYGTEPKISGKSAEP